MFNKDVPESSKLFKDKIYAEHFLTVMTLNDKLKVGFDWNSSGEGNAVEIIKCQKDVLELLSPFFTEKVSYDDLFHAYRIDKIKAFSFMHKFLAHEIEDNQLSKRQYELLNSLHYTTLNTDVSSIIYSETDKEFKTADEIMNEKILQSKLNSLHG